jgi:chemotaxis protein methyltransferase CheR
VFCRNVLIYFGERTVAHVARLLADAMPDDGFLCLGASESLTRYSTAFTLVEVDGAFMYTKGSASADDGASRGAQR